LHGTHVSCWQPDKPSLALIVLHANQRELAGSSYSPNPPKAVNPKKADPMPGGLGFGKP
jgi:hypothetical protein